MQEPVNYHAEYLASLKAVSHFQSELVEEMTFSIKHIIFKSRKSYTDNPNLYCTLYVWDPIIGWYEISKDVQLVGLQNVVTAAIGHVDQVYASADNYNNEDKESS